MQQTKPDLVVSDLFEQYPPRKLIINVADIGPGRLTLLEALDIAEASGIEAARFSSVLERGSLAQKARLMYAFAWVVARRAEPDLTYSEVCTYFLEVKGVLPDDKAVKAKAEALVGVASLAGVSTEEAGKMTLAEVEAVSDLHKRRNVKRTTPRRRRAG